MQRLTALYVHGSNPKVSRTSASDAGTRTKPGTLQYNRLLGDQAEIFQQGKILTQKRETGANQKS